MFSSTKKWLALMLIALPLAACGPVKSSDEKTFITASYPTLFILENLRAETGAIVDISGKGDPHESTLSARDVAEVHNSDLIVWYEGIQPALDKAIQETSHSSKALVNLSQSGSDDPHVWLNPRGMMRGAQKTTEALSLIDPENEPTYRENLKTLIHKLAKLDSDYTDTLAKCETRTFVTSHAAFGHLAAAYDLNQVAVLSVGSHDEASAASMAKAVKTIEKNSLSYVFEQFDSDSAAKALANETGVKTLKISSLEVPPSDGTDYIDVMYENLEALSTGLKCGK